MINLDDSYRKILADSITVSLEDLNSNEFNLINMSLELFKAKLSDIKTLEDEVKRLNLELANLKAMTEDDARYTLNQTGECPTCGKDDSFRNDY